MPRLKGQTSASSWPDIHLETLRRMWAAGKTGKEIAAVVPYSRCAVLAKARRLGLEERARTAPRAAIAAKKPSKRDVVMVPITQRMMNAIDLVADRNFPLREAAERANVPFKQLRAFFNWLVSSLDMGELVSISDDVVRPRRA